MRILMTTDTVGGVWTYSLDLIAAFESYCCDITLATMGAPLRPVQRAELQSLRNVTLRESTCRLEWMENSWADMDEAGEWLMGLASEAPFDLIHLNHYCHGNLPWSVPIVMVGHSCVWSWHHAVRGTAPGAEWSCYYERVQAGLRAADRVITPSWAMRRCLEEHYGPLDSIQVIYNARNRQTLGPSLKRPFVLAAGRLWDEAKNVDMLARVARRVAWPIHLAGDTAHPDGGTREVAGVKLLGPVDSDHLAHWMSHAAIYALPAKYEPFGLSILEAALSGCALVLGDIPSLSEIWGQHALYVDPNSEDELAETINRLTSDMHLRARYASRARERALQLTPARMAAEYYATYQQLANRANGAVASAKERSERDAAACAS